MGRRNDHSADEFDQMVVRTVWHWLESRSASELSLRKIAGLIGYAPSTLVSVYGSYSLLLLRVNSFILDQLTLALKEQVQSDSPREQLLETALAYLGFAKQYPHAFRLVFEHKMPEGQKLPAFFNEKLAAMFDMVEGPLTVLHNHLTSQQLEMEARMLWASVHGICNLDIDDKLFWDGGGGEALICTLLGNLLDKESP
ncbi:TetR-like C-terminal domain-containing protein [Gallaecimonas mangrovi]|uniref:TetR-like C-terminal domain-containing protein n=1 Tax=Gallaecimonas mangrovi TaxID=2291597 RepID=UPI000E1FD597|nr:TetR-like C-terminal domain-containing protein [Gallaecimonas mangrovi]